jgi:sterol desaturase/sphingolipid hydroxylase (fatty acid hydroxylase superfamily)
MELATGTAFFVFFVLVAIEAMMAARKQVKAYHKPDTYNNILLGILTFVTKVGIKGTVLAVFYFFHRFALFDLSADKWWTWVPLFLANDFLFYLFHRLSHESRIFWAAHAVHHSSKVINFTTSMRGNFVIMLYRFIFWIPLVLLGFDPLAVVLMDSIAFFYQLWIHTELIGRLGFLELFLNTPSHHRVHHASNEAYIDKNYAAVLIVWDRLFGTFEEEHEKPRYGLTKDIGTYHPVRVAFHEYIDIARDLKNARTWNERWNYLFKHPGWKPERSE